MKPIIFFDTETTDLVDGRLVEIALSTGVGVASFRVRPPVPITVEAMGVHHITNEDVEKLPHFMDHGQYDEWKRQLEESICVAHNAPFDIGVMEKEGVHIKEFIDTKQVAKQLYPDMKEYKLQTLRYYLGITVTRPCTPHTADCDVRVLMAVFEKLKQACMQQFELDTPESVIEKMLQLTRKPVLLKTFPLGKYFGKPFKELSPKDDGYLRWMKEEYKDKDKDLSYTCAYWLGEAR